MKIRSGFVSNSSSSSFIICTRQYITGKEAVLEYIKSHEACTGYYEDLGYDCSVYFEIKGALREAILSHADSIESFPTIVDDFHYLDENSTITADMVGCELSVQSGWDGEGCDRYIVLDDMSWGEYDRVLEELFPGLTDLQSSLKDKS